MVNILDTYMPVVVFVIIIFSGSNSSIIKVIVSVFVEQDVHGSRE